ncbi:MULTISPECIES: polysaccharide deacetylase family protein [Flavobacterium]|uniref:Polysaccharide deacetylase family protein n=1 Tax=Flavobacterium lipolyticum TaxID=2893754 RepID=A0ABS8M3H7_9FLAO|nr:MULTISPECIES: polysaccharide deacetylase family protein [unclassified Flavobacterium]MCC9019361.1 polysaccharide deacetylase family protein [Flavobacterium sp. F-126]
MSKLPILMYHNVVEDEAKSVDLSVSVAKLESQFKFLHDNNYTTFHFKDLENFKELPSKSIIITFDDVTECQLLYAVPLLEKYQLKASFFIPFSYVGNFDYWIEGKEKIMSVEQLKGLNPDLIELGYHSFEHKRYSSLSKEELEADFAKSNKFILDNQLDIKPVLAYPFGNYAKKHSEFAVFENMMRDNGIQYGLRIGNRVNNFPFKNNYLVKRIDIKGEDSLFRFKLKLKIGKLKLF